MSPEGSVSVFPLNKTFNRGDNVTFDCSAQGGPGNSYQWQWNGADLDTETAQTLTVSQISAADGGEYTCVVSNAAGSDSASTLLNVSPEIVLNPTDVLARNGTVLMLLCEARGFPEPQYEWMHVTETASVNVVGANSSMLVFDPVMFGDEGSYYCMATSKEITVNSSSATLTGSCVLSLSIILLYWLNILNTLQYLLKVAWLCYLQWLLLSLEFSCCSTVQCKAARVSSTNGRDTEWTCLVKLQII